MSFTPSPSKPVLVALANQLDCLADSQRAFEALEQLISRSSASQRHESIDCERADLGALLRLMNRGVRAQLLQARALGEAARAGDLGEGALPA